MGGKIAKSFEVTANVSLKVQVKQGDFESEVERVKIEPEELKKVEFNDFSDLRLVTLRKEQKEEERKQRTVELHKEQKGKERRQRIKKIRKQLEIAKKQRQQEAEQRRKEQANLKATREKYESEQRRKVQAAKMKELFKNTKIEIRTYGHLYDVQAYSLYYYFNPSLSIGYNKEIGSGETSPDWNAEYVAKYKYEVAGPVIRIREKSYFFEDTWSLSLFKLKGGQHFEGSSYKFDIEIKGITFDYSWYWQNGFSILFGVGPSQITIKNELKMWEEFKSRSSSWVWGLLNVGYMF